MADIQQADDCVSDSENHNSNLLVAIGASAGGVHELVTLVKLLPDRFEGTILIATHRTAGSANLMLQLLEHFTELNVVEPQDDDKLECGTLYIGKPEHQVAINGRKFDIDIDVSQYARHHRIDTLFRSVANSAGKNAVGVVLSGMLWDGVEGLSAIHKAGGYCIVQDPNDAKFRSMPEHAIAGVPVDYIGTTEAIAERLSELAVGRTCT